MTSLQVLWLIYSFHIGWPISGYYSIISFLISPMTYLLFYINSINRIIVNHNKMLRSNVTKSLVLVSQKQYPNREYMDPSDTKYQKHCSDNKWEPKVDIVEHYTFVYVNKISRIVDPWICALCVCLGCKEKISIYLSIRKVRDHLKTSIF